MHRKGPARIWRKARPPQCRPPATRTSRPFCLPLLGKATQEGRQEQLLDLRRVLCHHHLCTALQSVAVGLSRAPERGHFFGQRLVVAVEQGVGVHERALGEVVGPAEPEVGADLQGDVEVGISDGLAVEEGSGQHLHWLWQQTCFFFTWSWHK